MKPQSVHRFMPCVYFTAVEAGAERARFKAVPVNVSTSRLPSAASVKCMQCRNLFLFNQNYSLRLKNQWKCNLMLVFLFESQITTTRCFRIKVHSSAGRVDALKSKDWPNYVPADYLDLESSPSALSPSPSLWGTIFLPLTPRSACDFLSKRGGTVVFCWL